MKLSRRHVIAVLSVLILVVATVGGVTHLRSKFQSRLVWSLTTFETEARAQISFKDCGVQLPAGARCAGVKVEFARVEGVPGGTVTVGADQLHLSLSPVSLFYGSPHIKQLDLEGVTLEFGPGSDLKLNLDLASATGAGHCEVGTRWYLEQVAMVREAAGDGAVRLVGQGTRILAVEGSSGGVDASQESSRGESLPQGGLPVNFAVGLNGPGCAPSPSLAAGAMDVKALLPFDTTSHPCLMVTPGPDKGAVSLGVEQLRLSAEGGRFMLQTGPQPEAEQTAGAPGAAGSSELTFSSLHFSRAGVALGRVKYRQGNAGDNGNGGAGQGTDPKGAPPDGPPGWWGTLNISLAGILPGKNCRPARGTPAKCLFLLGPELDVEHFTPDLTGEQHPITHGGAFSPPAASHGQAAPSPCDYPPQSLSKTKESLPLPAAAGVAQGIDRMVRSLQSLVPGGWHIRFARGRVIRVAGVESRPGWEWFPVLAGNLNGSFGAESGVVELESVLPAAFTTFSPRGMAAGECGEGAEGAGLMPGAGLNLPGRVRVLPGAGGVGAPQASIKLRLDQGTGSGPDQGASLSVHVNEVVLGQLWRSRLLPGLEELEDLSGGRLTGELHVVERPSGKTGFQGELELTRLVVLERLLSDQPVCFPRVGLTVEGAMEIPGPVWPPGPSLVQSLVFEDLFMELGGGLSLSAWGSGTRNRGRGTGDDLQYSFHVGLGPLPGEDLQKGLPRGLIPILAHSDLEGHTWLRGEIIGSRTGGRDKITLSLKGDDLASLEFKGGPNVKSLARSFRLLVPVRPGGELILDLSPGSPDFVPLEQIPPVLQAAVITAEDALFYEHQGLDMGQISQSLVANINQGRIVRGGSTITQQLAKNLFLTMERTVARKLQEVILAWRMEDDLSKDRILELYFNVIEWGTGIWGLPAATAYYFQKEPHELTPAECLLLAVLIPEPKGRSRRLVLNGGVPDGPMQRQMVSLANGLRKAGYVGVGEYRSMVRGVGQVRCVDYGALAALPREE